jgi:hypothetical protein
MECKKEQRMSKKSWDKDDNDDTERLRRRLVDVVSRFNVCVHDVSRDTMTLTLHFHKLGFSTHTDDE